MVKRAEIEEVADLKSTKVVSSHGMVCRNHAVINQFRC